MNGRVCPLVPVMPLFGSVTVYVVKGLRKPVGVKVTTEPMTLKVPGIEGEVTKVLAVTEAASMFSPNTIVINELLDTMEPLGGEMASTQRIDDQ